MTSGTGAGQAPRLGTPVALFVYRRSKYLDAILDCITRARPPRVYVFADAPRDTPADREGAARALAKIERWSTPFPVELSVAACNLGNSARIESGIATTFETEDRAIFLEDDVVLSPSFLGFCDRCLDRYSRTAEVMMISGLNPLDTWTGKPAGANHLFSTLGHAQAWATWRRAWQRTDGALDRWRAAGARARLTAFLGDPEITQERCRLYDALAGGRETSWDYRWALARQLDHGLSVVPTSNLALHAGQGADATNLRRRSILYNLARLHELEALSGPDPHLAPDRTFDRLVFELSHDRLSPATARLIATRLIEGGRRLLAVALLRHAAGSGHPDPHSEALIRSALGGVSGNHP